MDHRHRKIIRRRRDRLSKLPVEILSTIISLIPQKDAVRTSVLARDWKFLWTTHPDVILDSHHIIGRSDSDDTQQKDKFIEAVDSLMEQRDWGLKTKIDSFTIDFPLAKDSAANLDRWIASAVSHGVEKMDIDLSGRNSPSETYDFGFPVWHAIRKDCKLKYLKLDSCNLGSIQNSTRLKSLVTVELRGLKISDEQMENLLSACSSLENLSIHGCTDLDVLKFTAAASFTLKFLSIKMCTDLTTVELHTKNLHTLEYSGQVVDFLLKDVPKLTQVYLGLNRNSIGMKSTVPKFANLPQVKTLNLMSISAAKDIVLLEEFPAFANVNELVLTVYPFNDADDLDWISVLLKSFPCLSKLQLNLFCPSFIPTERIERIEAILPEIPYRNLKELEMNGFNWNQHEKELLQYLVDNCHGLEKVVINQSPKVYTGFDDWAYEDKTCLVKFDAQHHQRLRAAVDPSVLLDIRCF